MRLCHSLSSIAAALALASPVAAGAMDNEVSVQPNPAVPGQAVVLHWLFTGSKVVLSGGRFGKGVVVTGKTYIADHPRHTTRYTFNVYYTAPVLDKATGRKVQKSIHVAYTAVAEVQAAVAGLKTYRDPYGWQICYLDGWKSDAVQSPDPKTHRLIYFQKEEDSVERLAVSVSPAESMTCKDLMGKVQQSLASSYEQPIVVSDKDTTCCGVPAVMSVFTGTNHAGEHTQSVVLVFVKDGRGFVVSARTSAGSFAARRAVLEKLIGSVAVAGAQASARQTP